jgi:putative peptidoglycan lipid II flippase
VGAVVAAGMAASSWIVLAFGSDPGETAILTRIMFPYLGLVSIAALFQGMLNSYGIFAPPAGAYFIQSLLYTLPMLVSRWTVNPPGLWRSVWLRGASPRRPAAAGAAQGWNAFRLYKSPPGFRQSSMKKVFVLIAPTILGMAAYQINDLVSTAFASRAGVGVASSLQFSIRLQELILGIFAYRRGRYFSPNSLTPQRRLNGSGIRPGWDKRSRHSAWSRCPWRSFP